MTTSLKTVNVQTLQYLANTLHSHMQLFGYELINLPEVSPADIFLTRAGDKIIDKLFTFTRLGQQLALRPEFTAAAVHAYIQQNIKNPVRWQMRGNIFVDDSAKHNRDFERYSLGAEMIGLTGSDYDAEIIGVAALGIEKLGLSEWQLVIGHVGLLLHLLNQFKLDSLTIRLILSNRATIKDNINGKDLLLEHLKATLELADQSNLNYIQNNVHSDNDYAMLNQFIENSQNADTMGGRSPLDIAQRLLAKRERSLELSEIEQALTFLERWMAIDGTPDVAIPQIKALLPADDSVADQLFDTWMQTIHALIDYGINQDKLRIQADLAKNWEYYTGMVFAIDVNGETVVGGGRYDGLTTLLGSNESQPAVGFAYYINVLSQLVTETKSMVPLTIVPDIFADGVQIAQTLRSHGIATIVQRELVKNAVIVQHQQLIWNQKEYQIDDLIVALKDYRG